MSETPATISDTAIEKALNGSDILVFIGGKAVGHCSSNVFNFNAETKDRAYKPKSSNLSIVQSLFKGKSVTGLSCSIQCDELVYTGETELTAAEFIEYMVNGRDIEVKSYFRGQNGTTTNDKPWLTGTFVGTSMSLTAPANDDVTLSGTLENSGAISFFKDNMTLPSA